MSNEAMKYTNRKRNNHYLPQMYLKQWSNNGNTVWTYETVVWDERQHIWKVSNISKTAFWRDFYSRTNDDGTIDDAIENLLANEYECQAEGVIKKVRTNRGLSSADMSVLVDFAILQKERTPAAYLRNKLAMELAFCSAASKTAGKFLKLKPDPEFNEKSPTVIEASQEDNGPFPKWTYSITKNSTDDDYVFSMPMNRENYLASIGHVLYGETGRRMRGYEWSVITVPEVLTLPTCDDPFVEADLRDSPMSLGLPQCTNCFMPLTPRHLLFADTGRGGPNAEMVAANTELLKCFCELIVQRALRYVYDREKSDWIPRFRPRRVDPTYCEMLADAMRHWNEIQDWESAGPSTASQA